MLGNSSCSRPLALLADLDRAAKVLGTRFARLACFPMGRKHPQGAVMRSSRYSRLARALRERPRLARVSGRPRRASNASGLGPLDAAINRDTNDLLAASIELMRSRAYCVSKAASMPSLNCLMVLIVVLLMVVFLSGLIVWWVDGLVVCWIVW